MPGTDGVRHQLLRLPDDVGALDAVIQPVQAQHVGAKQVLPEQRDLLMAGRPIDLMIVGPELRQRLENRCSGMIHTGGVPAARGRHAGGRPTDSARLGGARRTRNEKWATASC
jgi:hypothetical protein